MKKTLLLILLLGISSNAFSADVLVIVDRSSNLDYYVNGRAFKIRKDLKELTRQFGKKESNRLVLVEIEQSTQNSFKGRLRVIGRGLKKMGKFDSPVGYKQLLSRYLANEASLVLHGHTLTPEQLALIMEATERRFGSIASSACKMAGLAEFEIFAQYTNLLLASPENVHLAHFSFKGVNELYDGELLASLKLLQQNSFERLRRYSSSNIVLNIYDLGYFREHKTELSCAQPETLLPMILEKERWLSTFEDRKQSDSAFILKDCSQ